MKLSEGQIGQTYIVEKISTEKSVKRRLMDMGLTKGQAITIRKFAPLGDPIEITVRGYELTLRLSEAECIVVNQNV